MKKEMALLLERKEFLKWLHKNLKSELQLLCLLFGKKGTMKIVNKLIKDTKEKE